MRYLKITLSGAALFLIYLWVTLLLNSCNGAKPTPSDSSSDIEMLEEEMDVDYSDDEFEGGMDDGDYEGNSDAESYSNNEDVEENEDYVAGDYTASPEKTKLEPRKKRTTSTTNKERTFEASSNNSSSSAGSSYGQYMVIAGSYLLEDNANKMIRKLKGMGYSNAEIIYFDQSQYHSICAGRYDSNSSAKQTANSLQNSGIDSYVHRKQN